MSLYLKYRPQDFDSIIGQSHVTSPIKLSIEKNDYSHAFLLSGSRGTGKTTLARIIAKALNCNEKNKPCNICYSCKSIADGTFPDLIEINAANNRGIDDIRQIIDRVGYAPTHKVKIYLIDECHMLTKEASNALLKVLEEPPTNVVFILATTEEEKLLPTIKSRCQIHRLRLISKDDIVTRLKFICDSEKLNINNNVIEFIAEEAKGGLRDAISLLDLIKNMQDTTIDNIKIQLGKTSNSNVIEIFSLLEKNDLIGVFSILNTVDTSGMSMESFLHTLEDYLRYIHYKTLNITYTHLLEESIEKLKFTRSEVILLFDCLSKWRTRFLPLSRMNLEVAFSDFCLNRNKQNIDLKSNLQIVDYKQVIGNGKTPEEEQLEPEIVATSTADYISQIVKRLPKTNFVSQDTNITYPNIPESKPNILKDEEDF